MKHDLPTFQDWLNLAMGKHTEPAKPKPLPPQTEQDKNGNDKPQTFGKGWNR